MSHSMFRPVRKPKQLTKERERRWCQNCAHRSLIPTSSTKICICICTGRSSEGRRAVANVKQIRNMFLLKIYIKNGNDVIFFRSGKKRREITFNFQPGTTNYRLLHCSWDSKRKTKNATMATPDSRNCDTRKIAPQIICLRISYLYGR